MATDVKSSGMESIHRSGQQSGERAGINAATHEGSSTRYDLKGNEAGSADSIAGKAKEAGDTLMDNASDDGHSMQETGHNIAEKSKHAHKAICDFTKENPSAAILLAFGLGAILARVLPGR